MRDPEALYELSSDSGEVPHGLSLVAGLTGFTDAGSAVSQLSDHLLERLESRPIAVFDNDELLDYRARRPIMLFDEDHLVEYTPASLALHLVEDELHQPFLLLTGYEPDFQWERFTTAVLGLLERFQVRDATWVHAIPMPVPHTRPLGVTVSGNRAELVESMSVWRPTTQVPSHALHLLEYRLQETSLPTAGLVILVPHYLADTQFPGATVKALEGITAATGLIFPTDELREAGREFMAKVDDQVGGNAELQRLVETLEKRHDTYMEENPLPSPFSSVDGGMPSADTIAAELEKFLAARHDDDGDA